MKILHIIYLAEIGGLEVYTLRLAKNLSAAGHAVDLCVLHVDGPIARQARDLGIPVYVMEIKNTYDLKGIFRFAQFLRTHKYDVVHVHDRNFLTTAVLALYCKAGKIFSEHGGELMGKKPWKRVFFYRLLAFQYEVIIANSEYTRSELLRRALVAVNKVIVIYNGIDIEKFTMSANKSDYFKRYNIESGAKVLGVIGRLVFSKGIDLFIKIAGEIVRGDNNRKYVFLIVGDGPERSKYEKKAATEPGFPDIRFLGWQKNVMEVIAGFDLYLFTSRWESFGLTLVEAMSMGVPIVGFNINGANEVAMQGETALLSPPFDIRSVARNAVELTSNRPVYQSFSRAAVVRASKFFSMTTNCELVLNVYNTILSKAAQKCYG